MSTDATRLILFGHPVGHSLSPTIQMAFAAQFDQAIDYTLEDVAAQQFEPAVRAFFDAGGRGANVTVPHKRAAFELADERSEAAIRAGAANVLRRDDGGRLLADNTDGSGLLADLVTRRGLDLAGLHVLLLGAGGAARGVTGPLLEAGVESLHVANRTQERARELAGELDERVQAVALESLGALESMDLIIHATAAGHQGKVLPLPPGIADERSVCCDLSYGEAAEPFLSWAQQNNVANAFDGLGMLVETAADSYELWFGQRPDTDPVYRTLNV